jgi:hypothetical protein
VLVILGLFVRLRVTESPLFAEALRAGRSRRLPIVDVLSHDARLVLLAAGSYLGISALGYLVIVYFVSYATNVLKLPLTTALALLLTAAVAFAISIVVTGTMVRSGRTPARHAMGQWRDRRVGARVLPADRHAIDPACGLAVTVMLVLQGAYIGVQPAVFAELFPTAIRYSGASVSMTLATIAGRGTRAVHCDGTVQSDRQLVADHRLCDGRSRSCHGCPCSACRRPTGATCRPTPDPLSRPRTGAPVARWRCRA